MRIPLIIAVAALASSCVSNGLGYRDHEPSPDVRLAAALEEYEAAELNRIVADQGRARNKIEALSFEYPAHVPTLLANGLISFEEADFVNSQRYLDRLFSVQAIHPEAALLRSRLALQQGNAAAAEKLLGDHLRHVPDHHGLHEAMAEVYFLTGRFGEAMTSVAIAEDLGAPDWRMAFNRGLIEETQENLEAAATHYDEALKCNPDMSDAESRLLGVRARLRQQSR